LVLTGLSLGILGFLLKCILFVCPKCRARLLWKAIKHRPYHSWLSWLISLKECPVCRFSA
jgi:hypothetical protein